MHNTNTARIRNQATGNSALGYICMYGDKRWETYADSLYDAKKKAIAHFKVKPKAEHRVSVYLAEKNGEDVMQVAS